MRKMNWPLKKLLTYITEEKSRERDKDKRGYKRKKIRTLKEEKR